jgi:hypothetical protein
MFARTLLLGLAVCSFAVSAHGQSSDKKKRVQVSFGRLTVISRGEDGVPLASKVRVYDQASGDRVSEKWTKAESGSVSFGLRPGTYKARVYEDNHIDREGIQLIPDSV